MSTRTNGTARYFSLDDAVARYGGVFSAWTLRDKARRGEVPHIRHAGSKRILFREDWLDAWDAGCDLERRIVRRKGLSDGRVVRPVGKWRDVA